MIVDRKGVHRNGSTRCVTGGSTGLGSCRAKIPEASRRRSWSPPRRPFNAVAYRRASACWRSSTSPTFGTKPTTRSLPQPTAAKCGPYGDAVAHRVGPPLRQHRRGRHDRELDRFRLPGQTTLFRAVIEFNCGGVGYRVDRGRRLQSGGTREGDAARGSSATSSRHGYVVERIARRSSSASTSSMLATWRPSSWSSGSQRRKSSTIPTTTSARRYSLTLPTGR